MAFVGIVRNRIGIEKEIDHFLDLASNSGLIFIQGMNAYLANNIENFSEHLVQNVDTEKRADTL